jgi:hypothetical protein
LGVSFPGEAVSPTFPWVRLASAGLCLLFSNFRFGTHRRAGCVKAYPAETTEAFLDGHVSAFAFFGGVPVSILYDNLKIAVARILGDGKRQRTRAFTELVRRLLQQAWHVRAMDQGRKRRDQVDEAVMPQFRCHPLRSNGS